MTKIFLSAVFLLLVSASTDAQRVSTTTGNGLLDSCESKAEHERALCLGYITGVTDMEGINTAAYPERGRTRISEDVTNSQVKDVVVKYLRDHPEDRHLLAAILIVEAVSRAFPCKTR